MLSVLIPVYNWDIRELASAIHQQCTELKINFEIIALDDCSPNQEIKNLNSQIEFPNFKFIFLNENVGNAEARNILARNAKNDWLLFLDADMIPKRRDFVSKYVEEIKLDNFDVMSGGIVYQSNVSNEFRLKWLHGRRTEEHIEGKNPYLEIRGNNFLVRKIIFLQNPFGGLPEDYGYVDTHFGLKLKQAKAKVKIIDNPCIHLGLETNQRFVKKFEKALKNADWMMKNQPEMAENLKIIKVYKKLKSFGLVNLVSGFYRIFKQPMYKNLTSSKPSLFVFQLYKLGYFCSIKDE